MLQAMGSQRVRHDLATEQQQKHGAGGTKEPFYRSRLSCLKDQLDSDMLCALQVLDEKALGLLCLPRASTLG